MEEPTSFSAEAVRAEKAKILASVRVPGDIAQATARGQYAAGWQGGVDVRGYLHEDGIPADSRTETYAAIKLEIQNRRWAGVPFYLRTGKRLSRRVTEVAMVFQKAPHLPFSETDTEELGQNALVMRVQPDEGITVRFGSKVPGTSMEIRDVNMDFAYGESFTETSPEAYERLLLDVLIGDPPLFPGRRRSSCPGGSSTRSPSTGRPRRPRPVQVRRLRPGQRRRADGAGRAHLEAALMNIDLTGTTTRKIQDALTQSRHLMGGPAVGMVLTLIIVTDESAQYDAVRAATEAAREHPCRVLTVISRDPRGGSSRLDAEIRMGETGPGETVLLRMYGPLAEHADSVVVPLLMPDTPVVTWWPGGKVPKVLTKDPLGALAQRRVTDSTRPATGSAPSPS